VLLGAYPMMTKEAALEALDASLRAYNNGRGAWPTAHVSVRLQAMERFLAGLRGCRDEIAQIIMWEICKTAADAAKEVDRTIKLQQ
jgi:glyceraldehyde-3-phosphate dehydrogenase (NADP+)